MPSKQMGGWAPADARAGSGSGNNDDSNNGSDGGRMGLAAGGTARRQLSQLYFASQAQPALLRRPPRSLRLHTAVAGAELSQAGQAAS